MNFSGLCHVCFNNAHSPTPSVRSASSTVQALRKDLSDEMSDTGTILYFFPVGTSFLAISSRVLNSLADGTRIFALPVSSLYMIL